MIFPSPLVVEDDQWEPPHHGGTGQVSTTSDCVVNTVAIYRVF